MTHHWQALGWTLVHFLWQGAAIALVYRVADIALARRTANARYLLALGALLGMLAVSVATLTYEESALADLNIAARTTVNAAIADRTTADRFLADRTLAERTSADRPTANRFFANAHLMPYLDGLWLAGVLFLSVRTLGGWWIIRRLRSRLQQAPHTLLLRLDVLRRQMNIPRFVDLRISSRITNPLTAGVVRPWILLPITALTTLSPEQLEVVLAHELAHIRRADYAWNLLQTIVETLFFFHPAVWWVSRRAREERELCCDDVAVRSCSDPTVYASALLRLEEERRTRLHLAMALDGHQSRAGLRARILRILGDREASPRSFRPISAAGIATALLVFLCPLPKVFASFRAVPQVAARIAPAASSVAKSVMFKAMHPTLQASAPAPKPSAAQPAPAPAAAPAPSPDTDSASDSSQESASTTSAHSDYIDAMRAAGYDVDLDKYIAMKVQGITPAYAAAMSKEFGARLSPDKLIALKVQDVSSDYISKMRAAGFDLDVNKFIAMRVQDITPEYAAEMAKATGAANLSADRLIAMRVQDVTPEYIAKMHADGYDADVNKIIAMKVQDIMPEYADAMAKVGFGKPTVDQLIAMKVQGVTPEFAAKLHSDGIEVGSFNDLIRYRIFNVSPEFIAGMKAAGFPDIPAKELVNLRVQNVTPEYAKSVRDQFPGATLQDLVQMRIFNINAEFIADAKRHGFDQLTVQKLVKLRISGILDDESVKK
ncbi:MAG TPA: M56 family metallopeptidase [Acidobacteriaceae bacterium]|jgi:beta-lactamase regulating signal transducer with metallopeptidase domain|nr:M56 family metallopeptidase [Acidobacteriaceae bacterium]